MKVLGKIRKLLSRVGPRRDVGDEILSDLSHLADESSRDLVEEPLLEAMKELGIRGGKPERAGDT